MIGTNPALAPRALIHIGPDKFLEHRAMNPQHAFTAMRTCRHRPEVRGTPRPPMNSLHILHRIWRQWISRGHYLPIVA